MFFTAYVLCSLSLVNLKTEGQTCKQKTSTKKCKIQIKILVNPGLAGFEQPGPEEQSI